MKWTPPLLRLVGECLQYGGNVLDPLDVVVEDDVFIRRVVVGRYPKTIEYYEYRVNLEMIDDGEGTGRKKANSK
ncbi:MULTISPECIES: hypothetical protein [Brevibacillus]|jgi:hypothetical protein|uniref:hypothetical protein n=1 Tax=Brevibacillus TaxID=55080 RepID=UPI000491EE48|nr:MULTISPECIES: hypothetical protein [Brevibacillus]UYZ14388.1 hypothetical protein A6764_05315 [Brevibacillus sp. WF146]